MLGCPVMAIASAVERMVLLEDYRLFSDGYVESLVTAQLNQEGVHVYVAKVRPLMKMKTDEGRLRKGVLRSLVYS